VQEDLDAISDSTINSSVHKAVQNSFEAVETTSDYMPLIVLAVVIGVVLAIVLGLGAVGRGGYGSAL
jgi:hypothetical protein